MITRKYTREQLDYLRLRARQGVTNEECGIPKDEEGLSEEELDDIISELQRTSDAAYQRSLIGVIYYAGFPERERHRKVLEPFFCDPHHADEIFRILCREWDLAAYYKQELREFIRGVPWDLHVNDPIGRCQQMAVDCVFEKWQKLTDPTLLRDVLTLYEKNKGDSRGRNARDAAYWSLWRLLDAPFVTESETIELAKELASRLEATPEGELRSVSSAFISALHGERTLDDYIAALGHENPTVRLHAAQSIASIGEKRGFDPLMHAIENKNEDLFVRDAMIKSIAEFGSDAIPFLIKILEDADEDSWIRHTAAVCLGKHGDHRALRALTDLSKEHGAVLDEHKLLDYTVQDAIEDLHERGIT